MKDCPILFLKESFHTILEIPSTMFFFFFFLVLNGITFKHLWKRSNILSLFRTVRHEYRRKILNIVAGTFVCPLLMFCIKSIAFLEVQFTAVSFLILQQDNAIVNCMQTTVTEAIERKNHFNSSY